MDIISVNVIVILERGHNESRSMTLYYIGETHKYGDDIPTTKHSRSEEFYIAVLRTSVTEHKHRALTLFPYTLLLSSDNLESLGYSCATRLALFSIRSMLASTLRVYCQLLINLSKIYFEFFHTNCVCPLDLAEFLTIMINALS